jgi:hypothetical protein
VRGGGSIVLEGFFVEFRPVTDAEAVHDAGVNEIEGDFGVGPGELGTVVDFELWVGGDVNGVDRFGDR